MLRINTVLCPVDFSDANIRELEMAVDICRSFGARLILHHNVHASPLGASNSWMWQKEHRDRPCDEDGAADTLREMLAEIPLDVDAEARLSNGLAAPAILRAEDQTEADLVIMATHGASHLDHSSVTERVIESSRCPVLVWQGDADTPPLRLEPGAITEPLDVLVPTDFSPASQRALSYAFDLARTLPLRLHLLHVLTPSRNLWVLPAGVSPSVPPLPQSDPTAKARLDLEAAIPQELAGRVTVHIEAGDPPEKIAEAAQRLKVVCIVMGAHARGLRRFFTRDTSMELLHKAACPVWFVPGEMAA